MSPLGTASSIAAAVCVAHGDPDQVRIERRALPEPGPGEIRVAVGAAAVNFPDVLLVADRYQLSLEAPFVPGSELAGRVDVVGEGVTGVEVGDLVFATLMHGAFAEAVVVPVDQVHVLPPTVDLVAAASFGVAHVTANDVVRSIARVRPGEDLVVLGAGGGVGLAAVELGARVGAIVTAVASSEAKLRAATARGAQFAIDHTQAPVREQLRSTRPDGIDVVIDPVGGPNAEAALRALRWGGRFVTVGYASGEIPCIPLNLVLLKGVTVLGYQSGEFRRHLPKEAERNLTELVDLLATGRIQPHVGATFPLGRVVEALRHVAEGRAIGKVVLTFPDRSEVSLAVERR